MFLNFCKTFNHQLPNLFVFYFKTIFFVIFQVVTLAAIYGVVQSSGVHHAGPIVDNAPVVTASSSQYFERTFNRLVAPPVLPSQQFVPVQPVPIPVQPVQHLQKVQHLQPVQHFQPLPSVINVQPVQPIQHFQQVQPAQPVQPVQPTQSQQPLQPQPVEPNVAIAIATANAAAPVATILLPPYPFGFPPTFGLIPREQPPPNEDRTKEETTSQNPNSPADVETTNEPEATTQVPDTKDNNVQGSSSNQDQSQVNFRQYLAPAQPTTNQNTNFNQNNNFAPLPSNQDANFRKYLGPKTQPQLPQPQPQYQPLAQPHHHHHYHPHTHIHVHPKKLKTLVEVQKVPLAYIAPPPLPHFQHHHQAIKVVKHTYSFLPSKAKLIIKPVVKTRSVQANAGYLTANAGYKAAFPLPLKSISPRNQNARPFNTKEIEPTTFRPFPLPNNKPPRL